MNSPVRAARSGFLVWTLAMISSKMKCFLASPMYPHSYHEYGLPHLPIIVPLENSFQDAHILPLFGLNELPGHSPVIQPPPIIILPHAQPAPHDVAETYGLPLALPANFPLLTYPDHLSQYLNHQLSNLIQPPQFHQASNNIGDWSRANNYPGYSRYSNRSNPDERRRPENLERHGDQSDLLRRVHTARGGDMDRAVSTASFSRSGSSNPSAEVTNVGKEDAKTVAQSSTRYDTRKPELASAQQPNPQVAPKTSKNVRVQTGRKIAQDGFTSDRKLSFKEALLNLNQEKLKAEREYQTTNELKAVDEEVWKNSKRTLLKKSKSISNFGDIEGQDTQRKITPATNPRYFEPFVRGKN